MPKFMTYQRPTPVNKASWGSSRSASPYQPVRRLSPQPNLVQPSASPFRPETKR